ncbi:MAG: hypothetical protein WBC82_02555 [Dehalococcoidia bacterium]
MSSPSRSSRRIKEEFGLFLCPTHRGEHGLAGFIGLEWSRSLRAHRVGLEEFLEEWYERSAETCDVFDNISEVDKYCVVCTVCRHFEKECCSPDQKGPSILSLIKATYKHDSIPWQPVANEGAKRHQHCL